MQECRIAQVLFERVPQQDIPRSIPDGRGDYLLILRLMEHLVVNVGSLGRVWLGPGLYVYVGSARGHGGVRARLARHLRLASGGVLVRRWHIDYLLPYTVPVGAVLVYSGVRLESCLAQACARTLRPGPARFGSTDTGDSTHLFYCPGNCRDLVLGCVEECCSGIT